MRSAIFRGLEHPLSIERVPDPSPGPRDVVIKVGRCGICGSDLLMTGTPGNTYPLGMATGHEYAGEIVASGNQVRDIDVGDRVAVMPVTGCGACAECHAGEPFWCSQWRPLYGGFSEYVLADYMSVIKLPASLSLSDGALVEPLAGGLHGVTLAGLTRGARIAVLGAGSMGLAVIFWARRMGAGRMIALARSNRASQLALDLGATSFLSIRQVNDLSEAIDAHLQGPPDIVFECTGARGLLEQAVECVKRRGTVVALGQCVLPDTWIPAKAMDKQVRIQFSVTYGLGDFYHCVDTLDAGAIEPRAMITDVVSLDELPAALEALRHPSTQCKVQVDPWAGLRA